MTDNLIQDMITQLQANNSLGLALTGDPSVEAKYGTEVASQLAMAGRDMYRNHARTAKIMMEELMSQGFTRQESIQLMGSVYPLFKTT